MKTPVISKPVRITDSGPTRDLHTDDLLACYTIDYTVNSMEELGIAMLAIIAALPDDRVWGKPSIYHSDDLHIIQFEGIKRKVFEEVQP